MANLSGFLPQIGPRQVPSTSAQNVDITVTAGETLAIRDCVYIAVYGPVGTPGMAYKADADSPSQSTSGFVIGFATTASAQTSANLSQARYYLASLSDTGL